MRNHQDACKQLLEMLLGIKIESMEMKQEETIALDYDSKGIRLDVFVKDTGRMFDVELQVANTKELPERARYYQGVMDVDTLKAGQKYKELRDRTYKHFFFAPLCAKMIEDKEVKAFFEFLISNQASSSYTDELKNYVADAKQSTENKMQFMTWERQRAYDLDAGREEGIAIGAQQKAVEDARSFYANGASIELISKSLNMTIEQVKEIVRDTAVSV